MEYVQMEYKLSAYEGPLDLLLRLIERAELNIYDIPIAQLTDQYLDAIKDLPMDMANISEFIVMAATLLEIKSRMLLPKPPKPQADEEEDPRDALVRRLLEYKQCQDLAAKLSGITAPGTRVTRGGDAELLNRFAVPEAESVLGGIPLDDLWQLFAQMVARQASRKDPVRADYGDMPREKYTVTATIARLRELLKAQGQFKLSDLLSACVNKREMVVTFLAMLEMIRQGNIQVKQDRLFKEIYCTGVRE
jgi:segregation and condensation protein A